jgi:hypothetical protein
MTATNQVAITNENGVTATVLVSSLRLILVLSLFCKQSFADFLSVDRLERQIRFCLRLVRVGAMMMREWDLRWGIAIVVQVMNVIVGLWIICCCKP